MRPIKHRRDPVLEAMREASALPGRSVVDLDPEDPSQLLDDAGQFSNVDVEVEAQPHVEADVEGDAESESFSDSELGENAFETLEKKTAEGGAEPEAELDIEDDSDEHRGHHRRDRPVGDNSVGR